jgi:hypothetical protein
MDCTACGAENRADRRFCRAIIDDLGARAVGDVLDRVAPPVASGASVT